MKKISNLILLLLISACMPTTSTLRPPATPTSYIKSPAPTSTTMQQIFKGTVVVPSLNIRSGPGRNYQVTGYINQGGEFYILGQYFDAYYDQWVVIPFSDDTFGWVNGEEQFITQTLITVDRTTYNQVLNLVQKARNIYTPLGIFQDIIESPSISSHSLTATPRPYSSPSSSIIDCGDTKDKIGEFVNCKIERAYCEFSPDVYGDPTFCNDARYPNHNFTLVVWGQDWSDYDGSCIIISGVVGSYQGKPQIDTTNRARISYCE